MKATILHLAGAVNMGYKELIIFYVACYGRAWKKELRLMSSIIDPGDKLAIDLSDKKIYLVAGST